eukprot:230607_1
MTYYAIGHSDKKEMFQDEVDGAIRSLLSPTDSHLWKLSHGIQEALRIERYLGSKRHAFIECESLLFGCLKMLKVFGCGDCSCVREEDMSMAVILYERATLREILDGAYIGADLMPHFASVGVNVTIAKEICEWGNIPSWSLDPPISLSEHIKMVLSS